jgi:PAS domain S-box-containing protein
VAVDPSPSAEALALLDTAACGLLQTHDDGRFIRVNRTFCDWVGHGADDLVGHRRFQDLLTIGGRIFHQTHWTPLLRMQGSVSEVKLELLHRDGTKIPMVVNAIRREEHGVLVHEIAAYVAHDRDKYERELVQSRKHLEVLLVERQRAEAELRLLNRQLDEASRAKDAFLATMSHEIRTPMNAVIGMTGLLRDTQLTDEQREFVETVRASGEHLLMLINDILDFSKIEAGKLEIEEAVFDLRSCVEEALDLIAAKAAEKRLELVFQAAPDLPGAVLGDAGRVRQVLLNLLSNAVKFTDRGEVVIELAAHRQADGRLLVEAAVRDTGIGIPEDKVGRLFQSFSQVDATNTRRRGGTGLGLVISRRLAEYMGGTITVETQAGIGSVFRFTFTVPEAEVSPPARPVKLSGVRVLAIDDNATNLRILRAQLEALEMSVRTTMSPREALAWVAAGERFDVAVLDMQMPETDGLALAQELRRLPGGAALPMILLSSLGAVRAEAEARGVELVAMLTKPVKQVQLLEALAAASLRGPAGATPVPHILAGSEADGLARVAPLRILVADDNTFNQRVAALTLTKLGQSCDMVANGHEAVQAVKDRGYDVVFMDVLMPELDGLEATRQIRTTLPSDRQPRIIAMTANALKGDRELCLEAGMDDYISKPIRREEIAAALVRSVTGRNTSAT